MGKDVAVFNVPPVYSLGLAAVSSTSGYRFRPVDDPVGWVESHKDSALLVGVRGDYDLELVVELTGKDPDSVVVTVIDAYDLDTVRESLGAGASGVVSGDSRVADVILALNAALIHSTVIPTTLARRLAADGLQEEPQCLEDYEVDWLQSIAEDTTVTSLGRTVGYSEREMYRRLKTIYFKMGVRNRTQALLKASRLGWIQ